MLRTATRPKPPALVFAWLILGLALVSAEAARAELPQNGWLVWASNRKAGRHEIYRMKVGVASSVVRLTTHGGKYPKWSPKGDWIAYERSNVAESVWLMRADGSQAYAVTDTALPAAAMPMFWLDDHTLVVQHNHHGMTYKPERDDPYTVDISQSPPKVKRWLKKSDFAKLDTSSVNLFETTGLTPNGRFLVVATDYFKNTATSDNTGHPTFKGGWTPQILDLQDKSKIYVIGLGCEGTASPTANVVYHVKRGATITEEKDIYTMKAGSLAEVRDRAGYKAEVDYPNNEWGHEYFPFVSTDGVWLTYGATNYETLTKGCHDHTTCNYDLYVHRIGAGARTKEKVVDDSHNDQWPHLYVGALWQPPQPKIVLSASLVAFGDIQEGEANPANKRVDVTNGEPQSAPLAALKVSSVVYAGSGVPEWLTVAVGGSGNEQFLTNQADISELTPNLYSATVKVAASGASNSPRNYTVSINVTPKPQPNQQLIALDPNTLSFGASTSQVQEVALTYSGSAALAAVQPKVPPDSEDWLQVTVVGSGSGQTLENRVDATGLAAGNHVATVGVHCANVAHCDNTPQNYLVTLTVPEPTGNDAGGVHADGGAVGAADSGIALLDGGTLADGSSHPATDRLHVLSGGCAVAARSPPPAGLLLALPVVLWVIRRRRLRRRQ